MLQHVAIQHGEYLIIADCSLARHKLTFFTSFDWSEYVNFLVTNPFTEDGNSFERGRGFAPTKGQRSKRQLMSTLYGGKI